MSHLDGPAGRASLVKLLRSVYMKGRDALILEMLVAARRHGVEDAVLQSIGGPGEQVPFPELASRVVRSLAVYAERRSAELAAAAELLAAVDVEPLMTDAGVARLRWLADFDVRARFGDERPDDMQEVLRMVDALGDSSRGARGANARLDPPPTAGPAASISERQPVARATGRVIRPAVRSRRRCARAERPPRRC